MQNATVKENWKRHCATKGHNAFSAKDHELINQSAAADPLLRETKSGQLTQNKGVTVFKYNSKCNTCGIEGYNKGPINSKNYQHIGCPKCCNSWFVCLPCQQQLCNNKQLGAHLKSPHHLQNARKVGMEQTEVLISEEQSMDSQALFPLDEICTELPTLNDVAIKEESTTEPDWMLSTLGPRSTDQVSKDEIIDVFGKDSTSPSFYHYESANPGLGAHFLVASAF